MEIHPEVVEYTCPVCTLKQQLARILGVMQLTEDEREIISEWMEPLEERLVKPLSDKAKEKGQMRSDLNFYADIREGDVLEKGRQQILVYGTKIQHYQVCLDVCPRCGDYYAVKTVIQEGIAMPKPPRGL